MFVSIKGSAYTHFRAALDRGDLLSVQAAAAELPRVNLVDALAICLLLAQSRDERLDRASTRWLGRFALERPSAGIADLRAALEAFENLPVRPDLARPALAAVCKRHGLPQAAAILGHD
jgi:hypothetical protein